jgi:cytochrome P450
VKTDPRPPGPKQRFPGEFIIAQRNDSPGFFRDLAREYGDIVYLRTRPYEIHLLSHPDLVEQVLVRRNHDFKKSPVFEVMKRILGEGLLTSSGDFHKRQRRIINPIFHHKRVHEYGDAMVEYGLRYRDRWHEGQTLDFHQEMMRLTLAIVGETLFGADVERDAKDVGRAMSTILSLFDRILLVLVFPFLELLEHVPVPATVRFNAARDQLNAVIYRLIEERRRTGTGGDLLSQLLAAQEEGKGMTDEQVRDEAMTIFLAGHETTAVALTWTFYLLSRHPEVEGKLHAELDEVLGDRPPSADDLPRLIYTHKVLAESMRLFPPAWVLGRQSVDDVELGGYEFAKGSIFLMSQLLIQRDERWFPDPRRFDPDRWDPEDEAGRPRYSYFPFGGGPRLCIGEPFAWMEGELLLATIAQKWRPRLVPGHPVALQPRVTLRPKYGMRMTLSQRT